jgi:DNA endonuclease
MNTFSELSFPVQTSIIEKVIELSWNGLGYKKIIKKIKEEFSVNLSLGLLSYWFNHEVKLFGGENQFSPKPSKELAYVLGVIFGDGNLFYHKKNSDYVIRLDAIDKDFVEKFSECVSKVLNKEKNYAVVSYKQKAMSSIMFSSKARSKQLYYFLKELKVDFEKVKPFAKVYPKEFIQGLADSEGCPSISAANSFSVGVCVASSMNVKLLAFVSCLLKKHFRIRSRVYKTKKKGMSDSVINGRVITRQNDLFSLTISNFDSTKIFANYVEFGIKRKNEKLRDATYIFEFFQKKNRLTEWGKIYCKNGNRWARQ